MRCCRVQVRKTIRGPWIVRGPEMGLSLNLAFSKRTQQIACDQFRRAGAQFVQLSPGKRVIRFCKQSRQCCVLRKSNGNQVAMDVRRMPQHAAAILKSGAFRPVARHLEEPSGRQSETMLDGCAPADNAVRRAGAFPKKCKAVFRPELRWIIGRFRLVAR